MTAARKISLISIEDYLSGELISPAKHEYVGGTVYAIVGARVVHNQIATAFVSLIHARLRGKPCQPFNSDMKVRVRMSTHTRFYYPDAMVVCDSNPADATFQDRPVVIAEVLSDATRRTDEGEKRDAYLTISTLSAYVLIDSDRPRVVAYLRSNAGDFIAHEYEGLDAIVPLDDPIGSLRLAELYERVTFPPAT